MTAPSSRSRNHRSPPGFHALAICRAPLRVRSMLSTRRSSVISTVSKFALRSRSSSARTIRAGKSRSPSDGAEIFTAIGTSNAACTPIGDIVERAGEHEFGHRSHKTVAADQRQKVVRAEYAEFGMRPPHQCLNTDDLAVAQIELGLIDQRQVHVVDRPAQLIQKPSPIAGFVCIISVHVGRKGVHTTRSGAFRRIHRSVSAFQQRVGRNVRVGRSQKLVRHLAESTDHARQR